MLTGTIPSGLWFLCSVLGATLTTFSYAGSIKRSTNRVITHARQILYPSATNKHDGVFL